MAIEERAKQVYPSDTMTDYQRMNAYIAGATEQCEIDIQRAKQWLKEFLCDTDDETPILESLERAMKGETK